MEQSLYDQLGGEAGLRALVKSFYRHMHELPDAKIIREMHPEDLESSEDKLFTFFSGWTGGPQLYVQKYGHPMLRRRHFPFSIGKQERDQWMICMIHAVEEQKIEDPVRSHFLHALLQVAEAMRNREG